MMLMGVLKSSPAAPARLYRASREAYCGDANDVGLISELVMMLIQPGEASWSK